MIKYFWVSWNETLHIKNKACATSQPSIIFVLPQIANPRKRVPLERDLVFLWGWQQWNIEDSNNMTSRVKRPMAFLKELRGSVLSWKSLGWLSRSKILKVICYRILGENAFHVLIYLRKEPQSLLRTKSRDFTVHFLNYEAFILFILTSHFFGKAIHSMEYDWSLKISISITSTSEANFRWQFPLIFMAKKKKHSPIIIFRNDTSPHSPVAYDTKVYNDIKQITSV